MDWDWDLPCAALPKKNIMAKAVHAQKLPADGQGIKLAKPCHEVVQHGAKKPEDQGQTKKLKQAREEKKAALRAQPQHHQKLSADGKGIKLAKPHQGAVKHGVKKQEKLKQKVKVKQAKKTTKPAKLHAQPRQLAAGSRGIFEQKVNSKAQEAKKITPGSHAIISKNALDRAASNQKEEAQKVKKAVCKTKTGILTIGSDCSGVGTDSVALQRLGIPHKVMYASEIEESARRVLSQGQVPPQQIWDGIQKRPAMKEPIDIYSAGFPCQGFSSAGANLGMEDPRCVAMQVCQRIIQEKPKAFVLENVKNILSKRHKDGTSLSRSLLHEVFFFMSKLVSKFTALHNHTAPGQLAQSSCEAAGGRPLQH